MRKNGKTNAVGRGGALLRPAGYTELSKIFGESVCTYPLGHRGRCRSQPFATKERYGCGSAACRYTSAQQVAPFFMKNSGKFATSQWADRVVGPYNDPRSPPVGANASCPPAGCTDFMGIFGEFVTSQRADVGIGPYRDCAYPGLLCKNGCHCSAQTLPRRYPCIRNSR